MARSILTTLNRLSVGDRFYFPNKRGNDVQPIVHEIVSILPGKFVETVSAKSEQGRIVPAIATNRFTRNPGELDVMLLIN